MNFHIENYRIFNVVAEMKSFSKAAEKLYMTQSAVSQSIKQLENSLNLKLFTRIPRGAELTQIGETLYKYTASSMELLQTGIIKIEELKNLDEGELKIGASDTIVSHFLLPKLEAFHKKYPKIRIKVINRVTNELIELLKTGKIDLAFCNLPIKDEKLEVIDCMAVHDTFVAGKNYKKDKIYSREEIIKLPLILLENKSNSRKYVDSEFLKSGKILSASIELGAHELLLQLAKINLGVACVIKEFSKEYLSKNDVFELKQKHPIPARTMGYCYLKNLPLTPAFKKFVKFNVNEDFKLKRNDCLKELDSNKKEET